MRKLISHGLKRLVKPETTYPSGDRDARVIAVATVKGGVGKTTTAVNLSAALARLHGARVLLIDLDAQGHCSASLAAHMPAGAQRTPVSDILLADKRLEVLDSAQPSGLPNLDLTPADPGLAEAEGRLSQKIGKERLLRDALNITRSHYDYIIIDCPPNKGNLTVNGLVAADRVLIPTDLSALSVQGADELIGTVVTVNDRLSADLDILGVVLTRVDGRTRSVNDEILAQIEDAWADVLLGTRIGINSAIAHAQIEGKTIFEFDPRSRGAAHYEALASEVVERFKAP